MSDDEGSSQIDPAFVTRRATAHDMHSAEGPFSPVRRPRPGFDDTSSDVQFEEDGGVPLPRESALPFRDSQNFDAEESAPLSPKRNGDGSASYSHKQIMAMAEKQKMGREALIGEFKTQEYWQGTERHGQKHEMNVENHTHRRYPLRSRNTRSGQVEVRDGNANQSIQALGYDTSNAFHDEQSMRSRSYGFGHGPASQQQPYMQSYPRDPSHFSPQSTIQSYLHEQHPPSLSSRRVQDPIPPKATADYMARACSDPEYISTPQPLLVILDLNGTLIFRRRKKGGNFVKRPGLDKFIAYLFRNFTVMIWTSSRPETAANIVKQIFAHTTHRKLIDIWARDTLGLTREQYAEKVQVYKPLDKVWRTKKIQETYPTVTTTTTATQSCWTHQNTILIDDSALKAIAQPYNIIEIPEFTHNPLVDEKKNMSTVMRQLRILSHQSDVSRKLREWSDMRRKAGMSPTATVTRDTIELFWEEQLAKEEAELSRVTGSEVEPINSLKTPPPPLPTTTTTTTTPDGGSNPPSELQPQPQPQSPPQSPIISRKEKKREKRKLRIAARDERLREEDADRAKMGLKPRTNAAQKNAARKLHLERLEADKQKYKMDWLERERERERET